MPKYKQPTSHKLRNKTAVKDLIKVLRKIPTNVETHIFVSLGNTGLQLKRIHLRPLYNEHDKIDGYDVDFILLTEKELKAEIEEGDLFDLNKKY